MRLITKLNPINYIAGYSPSTACNHSIKYAANGLIAPIFNYFIEKPTQNNPPEKIYQTYKNLSDVITCNYNHSFRKRVALKYSSFDFDYEIINKTITHLVNNNIQVLIDAEGDNNYYNYQVLTNELISEYNDNKVNIIKTYQMYRKNEVATLRQDLDHYARINRYAGIKLVRGAYWNQEWHNGNLITSKSDCDMVYDYTIKYLYNNNVTGVNIIATHNDNSIKFLNELVFNNNSNTNCKHMEYAFLLGMKTSSDVNNEVSGNIKKNVYMPFGEFYYMLPYMIRRYYEVLM